MELPSLRERRRALIEDDILRVAQELIAEKGYSAMSMDELATRVGISKPTLYGFFHTKADLAVAAARRGFEGMLDQIDHQIDSSHSALDQLGQLMQIILQYHHHQGIPALVASMPELMAIVGGHDDIRALKQRLADRINSTIDRAYTSGQIDPDLDPQVIGFAFKGLIMSYFHIEPCDRPVPSVDVLSSSLADLFIRGIRYQG